MADCFDVQKIDFGAAPGERLAVLGDPIHHSLSPAMHNAALATMGASDAALKGWHYHAIRVPAEQLSVALRALHGAEVCGINLTLPHKVDALALVEEVDSIAEQMGAVNTLVRTATGYRGTNTDGTGILNAIKESFGSDFTGRDVWLFGAGGAARGVAVEALNGGCARLTVVNRTSGRLRALQKDLARSLKGRAVECRFLLSEAVHFDAEARPLLINATSLGLQGSDPNPIPEIFLEAGADIYDTTYGVENALSRAAAACGCRYADGLSMLVWQGARSLEIWTGRAVPVEVMRTAAMKALNERRGS